MTDPAPGSPGPAVPGARGSEASGAFDLLTLAGFAPHHQHAFVVRGRQTQGPLFKPGPVPRDAILSRMGLEGATLHLVRQVHGAGVVQVPRATPHPAADESPSQATAREPEEADAVFTRVRGHAVGVATADCLPILLAQRDVACAAVHAGWRGLIAGVIEAAIERLGGGANLEAAIGPAIGPCCFEVGPEVAARFLERFPDQKGFARSGEGDRSRIDLPRAAAHVLASRGIEASRVRIADVCTRCRPEGRLESYRRDGQNAGRMLAVIGRV